MGEARAAGGPRRRHSKISPAGTRPTAPRAQTRGQRTSRPGDNGRADRGTTDEQTGGQRTSRPGDNGRADRGNRRAGATEEQTRATEELARRATGGAARGRPRSKPGVVKVRPRGDDAERAGGATGEQTLGATDDQTRGQRPSRPASDERSRAEGANGGEGTVSRAQDDGCWRGRGAPEQAPASLALQALRQVEPRGRTSADGAAQAAADVARGAQGRRPFARRPATVTWSLGVVVRRRASLGWALAPPLLDSGRRRRYRFHRPYVNADAESDAHPTLAVHAARGARRRGAAPPAGGLGGAPHAAAQRRPMAGRLLE
jgi:hypothetical protein